MGFAEMLIEMNVSYASWMRCGTAEEVMSFIPSMAREESARLGEARGSFPLFEESQAQELGRHEKRHRDHGRTHGNYQHHRRGPAAASNRYSPWPSCGMSWRGRSLLEVSPLFEQAAAEAQNLHAGSESGIGQKGLGAGYGRRAAGPKGFVRHGVGYPSRSSMCRIQAAFQKYTDNAVSKTVNLPTSATVSDVLNVLQSGLRSGMQGRDRFSLRQPKPGAVSGKWGDCAGVQVLRMMLEKDGFVFQHEENQYT